MTCTVSKTKQTIRSFLFSTNSFTNVYLAGGWKHGGGGGKKPINKLGRLAEKGVI
jgi:hypothetical protein